MALLTFKVIVNVGLFNLVEELSLDVFFKIHVFCCVVDIDDNDQDASVLGLLSNT